MGVWWKWLNCLIIRGLLPAKRIPSLRVVPRTRILCALALLQQLLHAKRKREGAIRTIEARRKRLRACGRRCVGAVHGRRCGVCRGIVALLSAFKQAESCRQ